MRIREFVQRLGSVYQQLRRRYTKDEVFRSLVTERLEAKAMAVRPAPATPATSAF